MTRQRITPVAVLLAAVLVMGADVAKAQETVKFAIAASTSVTTTARFVLRTGVVDGTRTFASSCMQDEGFVTEDTYRLVVVERDATPVATIVTAGYTSSPVPAGTRFVDINLVNSCIDGGTTWKVYEATIASPQNQELALTITPAGVSLTQDHEAVVGAGTDDSGIADAVCVKKGSQSIKTPIISDIDLEAGDRLTDFFEVDYDLETGETTYACWLEY